MVVTHLSTKLGANISIQSGVIDISPKFKMVAVAIFSIYVNLALGVLTD